MAQPLSTHNRSLPLLARIAIAIALGIGVGFIAPDWTVRACNTFCALFDQLLRFLIPLIIVGLVTPAIAEVGQGAKRLLLLTASIAYVFTIVSGLIGYGFSAWLFPSRISPTHLMDEVVESAFPAYFTIDIPPLMSVMTALVLAFLLGLGIAVRGRSMLLDVALEFKQIITLAIEGLIIPLLPFYIFGLFLDMTAAGHVGTILVNFIRIIVIIFVLTFALLCLQYLLAGLVTRRNPFRLLFTMFPAYATALGTSSSAATIPVTLRQTLKNSVSEEIAGFVVPLCATIHLSGSMLKIVSCAIAVMLMQQMPFHFAMLMPFILMLGITMIAAPGVPGGAIMAAVGLLDTMLGFSTEQQAMMITLYIAMDSFGTATNVTGDGAIALIVDRIHRSR